MLVPAVSVILVTSVAPPAPAPVRRVITLHPEVLSVGPVRGEPTRLLPGQSPVLCVRLATSVLCQTSHSVRSAPPHQATVLSVISVWTELTPTLQVFLLLGLLSYR